MLGVLPGQALWKQRQVGCGGARGCPGFPAPLKPFGGRKERHTLVLSTWKTLLCGDINVFEVDQCKLAVLIIHPLPGGEVEAGVSEILSHR